VGVSTIAAAERVRGGYLYTLSNFTGPIRDLNSARVFVDKERIETYVIYQNLIRVFNEMGMEAYRFGDDLDLGRIFDGAIDKDGNIKVRTEEISKNLRRMSFSFLDDITRLGWLVWPSLQPSAPNIEEVLAGAPLYVVPQAAPIDKYVKTVIDLLATWGIVYARPLILNFKEYTDTRDMQVLEYALDTFYYEDALSTVKTDESDDARILKNMIITEIDITNIKTVLRVIRDRIDRQEAKRFFIKGSTEFDTEKLFSLMKTGTIEGVMKQLEHTRYQFLTKIPIEYIAAERISAFEKELEKYLVKKAVSQFLGDPLSIAIPIAYIWAKYSEVTNIRVIARCKVAEMSEKELREALISV
jgi:hypothetical protein